MARPTNFIIALRHVVRAEVRQLLEQFMKPNNHHRRRRVPRRAAATPRRRPRQGARTAASGG